MCADTWAASLSLPHDLSSFNEYDIGKEKCNFMEAYRKERKKKSLHFMITFDDQAKLSVSIFLSFFFFLK